MPFARHCLLFAIAAAAPALCGCTVINTGDAITSRSILKAAQTSDGAVRVDIYWAELPTGDDGQLAADLWETIEETRLPADLRRRLASNGLRAGVVGGALPDGLLTLLNPRGETDTPDVSDDGASVVSLEETGVSRATYTLTPGRQIDLQAGKLVTSASVLIPREGAVTGRTFDQVQPTYTLESFDAGSSGATLRLSPELRHGEQRLRFASDENGVIGRTTMTRDIEAFPKLAIEATLAPGETLVVTSTPGAEGRLGGYLHRSPDDSPRRRAMLIRVAGTPREVAFDAGA